MELKPDIVDSYKEPETLIKEFKAHPTDPIKDALIDMGVDCYGHYVGSGQAYSVWEKLHPSIKRELSF